MSNTECLYTTRLLDKIALLNQKTVDKVDLSVVQKAIRYAKHYHATQFRDSGEPFYSHPLEVAYLTCDYCFKTNIIVTAILHDTIEDTDLTFEVIAKQFGIEIADKVLSLTRVRISGQSKLSIKAIVQQSYLKNDKDVLLVKIIDRLHNLETLWQRSQEKRMKVVQETLKDILAASIYIEIPELTEKLALSF